MQNLLNRLFGSPSNQPQQPALTPAQQEMNTLLETAATALEQGYHQTALETYQRGLTLAQTLEDRANEEHFLSGIGAVHVAQNDFEAARPVFERALELARAINDRRALARALNNIGSLHAKQQEWGVAQTYHQQALDAARETGDAEIIALALENLAKDYLHQDNPSYAQHLLKEAVVVTQAGGQVKLASRVVGLLAEASLKMGDRAIAERLFTQALSLAQQTDQADQQLRWLEALANLEMENRNYSKVIEYYQAAENLALRMGKQSSEFFMNSALELSTAYQMNGNSEQAEEYATRALAQARSADNASQETVALTRLGMAAYTMSDYPRAQSFLTEALAFYEAGKLTDRDEHIQILLTLGSITLRTGKLDAAQDYIDQAFRLARDADQKTRQAEALHMLGNLAAERGDRDTALVRWQDALDLLSPDDNVHIAQLRCDIARAYKDGGDFKAALVEYERALLLLNHINHAPTRGLVLSNAATLYTEMGEIDTAQAFYEEAIEIARSLGDARAESLRLGNLGWFYCLTGRPQSAIDRLEQALKISRSLDDTLMIAVQTNNLARTYYQLNDLSTARTLHKQAIAAATAIEAERWLAVFQSDLGEALVALDRLDEAEPLYKAALATAEKTADLENLVRTQARLAALYVRTARHPEAESLATQAEARARKMRYQRGQAQALAVLGDIARAKGDSAAAQQHYAEAYRLFTILHDPAAKALAEHAPQSA